MTKLWKKSSAKLNPIIEQYTVGDDTKMDLILMPYDIKASIAHAKMLGSINILKDDELESILIGLEELYVKCKRNKISISISDEDCHTVIENYLTDKIGNAGKKIHTGRSRNDQVLTALRLYMKHSLSLIKASALKLSGEFIKQSKKCESVPLPGYSHTQQAMPSSVGHYYLSFAESLIDDVEFIQSVYKQIDKCPLGSAAGFGVSIPLDRQQVCDELGFSNIQLNSLYCQNSRGKFESIYLEGLVQIMMTLGKFASDILLFTSQEFNFFQVDDSLVTGSSIMPQKKNLDGLEILRGNVSRISADQIMVKNIAIGLISGYHRDYQLIKKPLMESTQIALQSLKVAMLYLEGITPNEEEIKNKISKGIFSADIANKMVEEKGIPFRDAYKLASNINDVSMEFKPDKANNVSLGAPGNLGTKILEDRLLGFI
ncbi:argininosuccinate lyase [Patescibacteria group bacterium]|nr:argininosuccinate lyase [Patescibacteria group bacterium]MBU1123496.1 argininosuccinate lyase [Patescibacteria group bacterium]MBU1911406.1 argininosuccinate lyase [Patescibacteria group bacterium]